MRNRQTKPRRNFVNQLKIKKFVFQTKKLKKENGVKNGVSKKIEL